jgi:hypothetical protein
LKFLRLCLLVLLAALLPCRGALATAMVCAPAAPASHAAHGDGHDHAGHHEAAHEDATDTCNVCAASCAATPLLPALPGVAAPHALTAARYPAVSAPAPSFLSGGPERPPRSR